jgi:hypothetical protein
LSCQSKQKTTNQPTNQTLTENCRNENCRIQQSRQVTACLLAASPEGQMLLQQQGYAGAPAAEPAPTLMPGQTQPAPTETPPPMQP